MMNTNKDKMGKLRSVIMYILSAVLALLLILPELGAAQNGLAGLFSGFGALVTIVDADTPLIPLFLDDIPPESSTADSVTPEIAIPDTTQANTVLPDETISEAVISSDTSLEKISDYTVPLAATTSKVLKPVASGTVTYSGGSSTIDASNASEGYIMIKYKGSTSKVKVQITKNGKKTTYQYNLRNDGVYEVFPLTAGSGKYNVNVMLNVSGSQYSYGLSAVVDAEIVDSTKPFLYPNQFINFNADSEAVKKSDTLAAGKTDQLSIVSAVYDYVVANISYDTQKAQNIKSGYVPVIDNVLSTKKGICFDYASLMAAMLRVQGIPTKVEFGYVSGGAYHAWISTYIKDVGWLDSVIYFDGQNWKLMDPTFASSGGKNNQFIGNGSNYSTSYIY